MKLKQLTCLLPIAAIALVGLPNPVRSQPTETPKLHTTTAEDESITTKAGKEVFIPKTPPPLFPKNFTLPWDIKVSTNTTITTDYPITDTFQIAPFKDYTGDGRQNLDDLPPHQQDYSQNLAGWIDKVKTCMNEKPNLYRIASDGTQIPVTINKVTGKVFLNGNKKSVCVL
jgi:hypothetical protein